MTAGCPWIVVSDGLDQTAWLRQLNHERVSPGPDAPVLWVLTVRTGAGEPAVQDTLGVLQRANARFLRVCAMSSNAVTEMVEDAVGANADDRELAVRRLWPSVNRPVAGAPQMQKAIGGVAMEACYGREMRAKKLGWPCTTP